MSKIVLIYEYVPDRCQVYNLEVSKEELIKIVKCHNRFGNQTGNDEEIESLLCEWLPNFLKGKPVVFDTQPDDALPPTEVSGLLIHTGFML